MAVEFLPGNRLTLLRSGVQYFPALEAAIREAQREIFLETYIYAGDATGERVTKALCGAARRGVTVHVLVDGFGSRTCRRSSCASCAMRARACWCFARRCGAFPCGGTGCGACTARSRWRTDASPSSAASTSSTTWTRRGRSRRATTTP